MSKDFGDILAEWETSTARPYGKKRIKRDEKNKGKNVKEDNKKKINPMELWLRRYGVEDKDSKMEEPKKTLPEKRRTLRAMRPEAEIDLHGMTRPEAENNLNSFFDSCRRKGLKKILIIHGKGNHSKEEAVLPAFVADYLEHQKYAGETGHPKNSEGGTGSTWVILK